MKQASPVLGVLGVPSRPLASGVWSTAGMKLHYYVGLHVTNAKVKRCKPVSCFFFCCVPSGSSNCGGWVQLYFLFWVFRWSPNWAKTTSLPCLKGSLADSLLQVFWAYQLAMILQLSCRSAVAKASCQFGFLIIDACCWMFKWIHTGFIHDGSASAFGRLVITIHWLRKQAHIRVPSVLPVWSA